MAKSLGKRPAWPSWPGLFTLVMFVFMYGPIAVLAVYSVNASRYGAVWDGFSLVWYRRMLSDARLLSSLQDSLTIAAVAVLISAVIGTMMAVGLARYRFWGKGLYRGVSYLPLIVPDITIAVSTLIFLATMAVSLSLWTVIAAHTVFCLA